MNRRVSFSRFPRTSLNMCLVNTDGTGTAIMVTVVRGNHSTPLHLLRKWCSHLPLLMSETAVACKELTQRGSDRGSTLVCNRLHPTAVVLRSNVWIAVTVPTANSVTALLWAVALRSTRMLPPTHRMATVLRSTTEPLPYSPSLTDIRTATRQPCQRRQTITTAYLRQHRGRAGSARMETLHGDIPRMETRECTCTKTSRCRAASTKMSMVMERREGSLQRFAAARHNSIGPL